MMALVVAAVALPASAHAGFKAYAGFSNAPNPTGGSNTGSGDQSTSPYEANTVVAMATRAAAEPVGPWDPSLWSNVDLKVIVPAGWTNPTCGSANLQINDPSTNNTNQPGGAVAGWSCETFASAGHVVIHFWGPPVATGGLQTASAQYFQFSVTTPSPSTQTTYGIGGTEGFTVDQTYANGTVSHWYPSSEYVGTYPAGALPTTAASGLLRTVAAYVALPVTVTSTEPPVMPVFTG
jgi:hypothetical protein